MFVGHIIARVTSRGLKEYGDTGSTFAVSSTGIIAARKDLCFERHGVFGCPCSSSIDCFFRQHAGSERFGLQELRLFVTLAKAELHAPCERRGDRLYLLHEICELIRTVEAPWHLTSS